MVLKIHMENIVLISTMLRETDWKLSLSPHGSPRCSFASNAIRLGLLGSKTSLEGRMSGQTTQRLRTGGCSHGRGQNGTGVRTEQGSGPETRNPSVRARGPIGPEPFVQVPIRNAFSSCSVVKQGSPCSVVNALSFSRPQMQLIDLFNLTAFALLQLARSNLSKHWFQQTQCYITCYSFLKKSIQA